MRPGDQAANLERPSGYIRRLLAGESAGSDGPEQAPCGLCLLLPIAAIDDGERISE
jgi:hypothetical protein